MGWRPGGKSGTAWKAPPPRLHKESVEHGPILPVVVEPVDEPLIPRRQLRVSPPHDALVKIRQSQQVVLGVELEEHRVEALGSVVDGSRVGGVQDGAGAAAGQLDVDVALGDLPARVAVA
eukprot:scaffold9131_cov79-Isochrysis_galbana.AAC.1